MVQVVRPRSWLSSVERPSAVQVDRYQKNPRVRKIFVRNSGPGNGCANFMDAWKNASVLREKARSIKFLVLGGGRYFRFGGGGGSTYFIFMGAGIFLTLVACGEHSNSGCPERKPQSMVQVVRPGHTHTLLRIVLKLSGPIRDTPPYRAIPFRDSIAGGGYRAHFPWFRSVSCKYR